MAGKRLDGAQRAQVIEMSKAGKSAGEIVDFVRQTYDKSLTTSGVNYIVRTAGGGAVKTKRDYKKHGVPAAGGADIVLDEKTASIEAIVKDVLSLIQEGHNVYRGVFLHLRRELIKSVGKIRDLKKEFEAKAEAEASLALEDLKKG
jgi:hypothetical protein